MHLKSAALLILFVAFSNRCSSFSVAENDIDLVRTSRPLRSSDLLDDWQRKQVEEAIQQFMLALVGPAPKGVNWRPNNKETVPETIEKISTGIRNKLFNFANSIGLKRSSGRYTKNFFNSNQEPNNDWLSESVLQGTLMSTDLTEMINELCTQLQKYFRAFGVNFSPDQHISSFGSTDMKPFSSLDGLSDSGLSFFKCMSDNIKSRKNAFSFNDALANLTSGSPEETSKLMKEYIRNFIFTLPTKMNKFNSEMHDLICNFVTNNDSNRYKTCITEMKHIKDCMLKNRKSKMRRSQKSVPAWLNEMESISDCQFQKNRQGKNNISCRKIEKKIPKGTNRQVKYIYRTILSDQIPPNSSLNYAIKEFSKSLSKSNYSMTLCKDVCRHFVIYNEGKQKVERLARLSKNDKNSFIRYKNMTRSLEIYKRGLLKSAINTGKKMHHLAIAVENYLGNGIYKGKKKYWDRILEKLGKWFASLLSLIACEQEDTITKPEIHWTPPVTTSTTSLPTVPDNSDYNSEYAESNENDEEVESTENNFTGSKEKFGFYAPPYYRRKNDKKRESNETFNALIKSMTNLSKTRDSKRESVLVALANNLLLAAMFMETVGFISTLFYVGNTNKPIGISPMPFTTRTFDLYYVSTIPDEE
ncbi:uncharacterized protein [Prorops nasuta]|uniref:uncharacterized protein n=1 Tax=Prorops nasuta TaxID=863751 RepID=UPI0034CE8624